MGHVDFGRAVSAALDAVLVPAGFLPGQGGGPQVTFCAAHDDISDDYPSLPQANAQRRDVGACIDLVVDGDEQGRLRFADLEGLSLVATLQRIGRDQDADALLRVHGAPPEEAVPVLADVLARLFDVRR